MHEVLVQYRTQLMRYVLQKAARTRFESIIDFGCGEGANLRALARQVNAKRATGIDLSVTEVSYGSIVLKRGNILEFVPDTQYQLVISNQVFEHIYEPWLPKYFEVLKASCAPEGLIMISTPNRWRPKNILRALAFCPPYMMSQNPGVPPEQHLGHHRECSYRELRTILQRYFQKPQWSFSIVRTIPRVIESPGRWLVNILVYFLLWVFWRPVFVSASQDHYVIIQHHR
jgi:cyclopropane fatty-acyl-phospholipid synthase-like methyltransferase